MAKARGGAETADGWYFTGRDAATAAVVGHLTAAEAPRGFLFVTGGPGSGKSALLGRIVTLADPLMRQSTSARFRAEACMLPVGMVDVAVHARGRTLPDIVAEIAEAVGTPTTDAATLLSELRERQQRLTVVVDALDEAAEPTEITGGLLIQLAVLGAHRRPSGRRRATPPAVAVRAEHPAHRCGPRQRHLLRPQRRGRLRQAVRARRARLALPDRPRGGGRGGPRRGGTGRPYLPHRVRLRTVVRGLGHTGGYHRRRVGQARPAGRCAASGHRPARARRPTGP